MHIAGILSQDRLTLDPLKPIIIRGPPNEDATSVFTGNVVLSLAKRTKMESIVVTFRSTATTYWPEGIGSRGTRLSYDKILNEETMEVFRTDNHQDGHKYLPSGIHRFPFIFVVPNSTVETIEDVYGRVRHEVEVRAAQTSSLSLRSQWKISKTVLVLRTYMSDRLLTNNSLQDLSRTFEKGIEPADIHIVVEAAAFSSGELLHLRLMVQPHRKHVRLESFDVSVVETRKLQVSEAHAYRSDTVHFPLTFLRSQRLEDGDVTPTTDTSGDDEGIRSFFRKKRHHALDIYDTLSYRLAFNTPTCKRALHHTTYYKDILFRHHLHIHFTISYRDKESSIMTPPTSRRNSHGSVEHNVARLHSSGQASDSSVTPSSPRMQPASSPSGSGKKWLSKLRKSNNDKQSDTPCPERKYEQVKIELPITVFDCRLKEDFGRLPSYFELGATKRASMEDKPTLKDDKNTNPQPYTADEESVYLCPCYFAFRQQMERASHVPELATQEILAQLDRIPSRPPPDYVEM